MTSKIRTKTNYYFIYVVNVFFRREAPRKIFRSVILNDYFASKIKVIFTYYFMTFYDTGVKPEKNILWRLYDKGRGGGLVPNQKVSYVDSFDLSVTKQTNE